MSNYNETYNDTAHLYLPCGGVAEFDDGSGCSHRCMDCGTTVGSISMPRSCVATVEKWHTLKILGGKGWDYNKGCQEK